MTLQDRLETLRQEIEALRQRLESSTDESADTPRSEESVNTSYKLDQLIAEFLRTRERIAEAE